MIKSYTIYFCDSDSNILFTRRRSYSSKALAYKSVKAMVRTLNVGRSLKLYICSYRICLTPAI